MAYTLKLIKGGRTLDLMSGRYKTDFTPPDVALTPLIASGTSANRYGGGTLIDAQAQDRSVSMTAHVRGATDSEVARGVADLRAMLSLAGDTSEPLYLQYHPNSDVPEPLWGQRSIYYEIVFANSAQIGPSYSVANIRSRQANVDCALTVKPYAVGKKQQLALASGGVGEDIYGSPLGQSRGLQVSTVSPTGGNEITNPVFGHSTYTNDWTLDASLDSLQNTDPKFVLWGTVNSIRLTSRSTSQRVRMAINTGETNTHTWSCYAKLPDGSAVTSTHVVLFYSVALTTTYTSVGDGWYRLTSSGAGINAATNTGAEVKNGYTVYLTGFQMEESAVATPLMYGDLLGCAWAGTAHDTASTRAVGMCKVPVNIDSFRPGDMSVRLVVKFFCTDTFSTNIVFFDARDAGAGGSGPVIYFAAAGDDFRLDFGGVSIDSAAQTFAVGDIITLHIVGDETGGIIIYKNGVSIASSGSFNPSVLASYFFIGSDYLSTSIGPVTIMDCSTWDVALTAAQVLADYTNIAQVVADDQRVGAIPYLWTKDGDGIVDNCDGSVSGTARDNYCVVNGIPGSSPALTVINATMSTSGATIHLSNLDTDSFFTPDGTIFNDVNGTADVGTSSDDAYNAVSVSTSETTVSSIDITERVYRMIAGRDVYALARIADASTTATARLSILNDGIVSDWVDIPNTTLAIALIGPIAFPSIDTLGINDGLNLTGILYKVRCIRSSGTANVNIDYALFVPRPLYKIVPPTSSVVTFVYTSRNAQARMLVSASTAYELAQTTGDTIEFVPGKYNILFSIQSTAVTDTLTYNSVKVSPRYMLL